MIGDLNISLKQKAEELLVKSGLPLSLIVEEIPGGYQATFNKMNQSVSVNLRLIIRNSLKEQIDPIDYIEVVICHELGHAVDTELTTEFLQQRESAFEIYFKKRAELDQSGCSEQDYKDFKQEIIRQVDKIEELEYPAEERAYSLGLKYVPVRLLDLYNKQNKERLDSYKENYREMKK